MSLPYYAFRSLCIDTLLIYTLRYEFSINFDALSDFGKIFVTKKLLLSPFLNLSLQLIKYGNLQSHFAYDSLIQDMLCYISKHNNESKLLIVHVKQDIFEINPTKICSPLHNASFGAF